MLLAQVNAQKGDLLSQQITRQNTPSPVLHPTLPSTNARFYTHPPNHSQQIGCNGLPQTTQQQQDISDAIAPSQHIRETIVISIINEDTSYPTKAPS
jgi:hypothetical protein